MLRCARISGTLDLDAATIGCPLKLQDSLTTAVVAGLAGILKRDWRNPDLQARDSRQNYELPSPYGFAEPENSPFL